MTTLSNSLGFGVAFLVPMSVFYATMVNAPMDEYFEAMSVSPRFDTRANIIASTLSAFLLPVLLIWFFACALTNTGDWNVLLLTICAHQVNRHVVKRIVRQPRPAGSLVEGFGFPSNHCTVATICAGYLPWYSSVVLLVPVLVSRWWLRDHSLVQVLGGMACGALFLYYDERINPPWY
jgi:membrane-associated phospholipid phosphatase